MTMTMAPLVLIIIFSVLLLLLLTSCSSSSTSVAAASSIDECIATNSSQHCTLQANDECWNAKSFSQLVSSFYVGNNNDRDTSVLPQLRGTVDHLLSSHELTTLLTSLPPDVFITAAGYNTDGNNIMKARSQGYTAPVGYAAIGLRELSSMGAASYDKVLKIRELARKTTEQSLHLCPGTIYIDYTTISQKVEGGTHRPHADNCYHYYDEENNNLATCHTSATTKMQHPHPQRVAASILYLNDDFDGGEFYFANRRQVGGVNGDSDVVDTLVPVQPGRMIYFTSGAENLHGALPVRQRRRKDEQQQEQKEDESSRRLALALWYVTDPELEEYVPPLRDPIDSHQSLSKDDTNDGQQTSTKAATDPNDPNAPEQLFSIRIQSDDINFVSSLVEDMGVYLTSEKNAHRSFWKVNRYGENGDTLHVLFKDHSAMFSLNLRLEDGMMEVESEECPPAHNAIVVVERHTDGRKRPSLQYMLQESVMMHGVLDVLSTLIADAKLKENEMRKFSEDVETARQALPARRA